MKLSARQYAKILDQAVAKAASEADFSRIVSDFIKLVTKDSKLSKVNDILVHFGNMWDKRHNILNATVETADGEDINLPKQIGGKTLSVKNITNKKLIGGSVIKIGDYIIDNSVYSKINRLRHKS